MFQPLTNTAEWSMPSFIPMLDDLNALRSHANELEFTCYIVILAHFEALMELEGVVLRKSCSRGDLRVTALKYNSSRCLRAVRLSFPESKRFCSTYSVTSLESYSCREREGIAS